MGKSYFTILGVAADASAEEIRSAYRRLAKAYHPDHFSGGSEPFREIQEAYAVLGDSAKRQAYRHRLAAQQRNLRPEPPRQAAYRTYAQRPGTPEPLIPTRPSGPVGPAPIRGARRTDPSLDALLGWLFGFPFGPGRF
ncbi:J domain-containing protein [Desulfatitalea alkaliphila]|uniref:J domain-containing protein n=1 Tax=Desulfatitalea alkaliphila TaxID=2929485 RepID=A0AA41R380_9BACT|nr:J domain-containing protein [Desulfatitalea alkaliphila]MCJ8499931.1 J domain-containing protein [Desulfatitalea alkaliphila]